MLLLFDGPFANLLVAHLLMSHVCGLVVVFVVVKRNAFQHER